MYCITGGRHSARRTYHMPVRGTRRVQLYQHLYNCNTAHYEIAWRTDGSQLFLARTARHSGFVDSGLGAHV
jgi:hypothetical protein